MTVQFLLLFVVSAFSLLRISRIFDRFNVKKIVELLFKFECFFTFTLLYETVHFLSHIRDSVDMVFHFYLFYYFHHVGEQMTVIVKASDI